MTFARHIFQLWLSCVILFGAADFFARITYPVFFTMCITIPPKSVVLTVGRNSKIFAHNYATIIYEYLEKSRRFRGGRIRPAAAGPRRLRVSTGHSLRAAFRIRPQNKKDQSERIDLFCGGGGRIRTIEAKRSRFTVCPLWPLGNSPIFTLARLEPVDGRNGTF